MILACITLKARRVIRITVSATMPSFTKSTIVTGMCSVPRKTRADHHKRKTHTVGTFLLLRTGSKMRTIKFDTIHRVFTGPTIPGHADRKTKLKKSPKRWYSLRHVKACPYL